MRTYPTNSPQAAARIVALAVLADGHPSKVELDVLDAFHAAHQLGLGQADLHHIIHGVCDDLLSTSAHAWNQALQLDATTLRKLLSEIEDPQLRLRVFHLCQTAIIADNRLVDGEAEFLTQAASLWGVEYHGTHAGSGSASAMAGAGHA